MGAVNGDGFQTAVGIGRLAENAAVAHDLGGVNQVIRAGCEGGVVDGQGVGAAAAVVRDAIKGGRPADHRERVISTVAVDGEGGEEAGAQRVKVDGVAVGPTVEGHAFDGAERCV